MSEQREVIDRRRKTLGAYCIQDPDELAQLAAHIDRLRPRVVVEIGTADGGWMFTQAPFFAHGATIIGIDSLQRFPARRAQLQATMDRLKGQGFDTEFLEGCSDDTAVTEELAGILNGRQIDLLHIDGGHDYETVLFDWTNYGALVRKGGIVALHDVRSRAAARGEISAEEVWRLWGEIRASDSYSTCEIGTGNRMGIGVVWM